MMAAAARTAVPAAALKANRREALTQAVPAEAKAAQARKPETDASWAAARLECTTAARGIVQAPVTLIHERNVL